MGLTFRLTIPFYSGGTVSAEVPGKYDLSLNGRPYMIDQQPDQPLFTRRPIPFLRNQADTGNVPGEASLSPEELWRRSQDSWDHGAGQTWLDRADSDNRRFRTSKGVDVWERWALKLLPDTTSVRSSANTNLALCVAGTRAYLIDGTEVRFSTDLATWTAVTGLPGTALSIASDGFNVWTAHSGDVYKTTRSLSAASSLVTGGVDVLGYCLGRLMAAKGPALYNITDLAGPAALPTALFTHGNSDWLWLGFTAGQSGIYAGGYSGDKSAVYRITIKADGTGLDQPTVAHTLPDGELLISLSSYVGGIVLLGTTKGVRFAVENSDGTLTAGEYITTPDPVLCFEGQDDYVWYGLSNYDSLSTGLGRLHPTVFTTGLTPAYASDLMATGQGAVTSVVTFLGLRVFTVSGLGVFKQHTNKVAAGTLDTGLNGFGIPDNKVGMFLDVKVREPVDTNRAYISVDNNTFTLIGTRSTTSTDPFQVGEKVGETFEVRHELLNQDTDPTAGPVVTRWTLRAYPNPRQGETIDVRVRLFEEIETRVGTTTLDPVVEYASLRALGQSRQLVPCQLGDESMTVLLDDHQFSPEKPTSDGKGWQGPCLLRLKSLAT